MLQILHILRKDGRRHWPEILASLLLLGLYAHHYLDTWRSSSYSYFLGRLSLRGTITPVLVLSWGFLILRIVHGENLVGDRQWWVTKPYVWWKLLVAKLLFVVLVICVPLFFIQLYFLHYHGFPVFGNIGAVLGLQAGLALVFFFPSLVIGALTRTLGQAFLTIVGLFLALLAISWLTDGFSDSQMTGPADASGAAQLLFYLLGAAGVLLWQFAYRRTWRSRGVLFGGAIILTAMGSFFPDGKYVEKEYPLVEGDRAPAVVSLRLPDRENRSREIWDGLPRDISLHIPLKTSGIAEKSVVLFRGMKLTLTTPDGVQWTRGWRRIYGEAWPDDESTEFSYQMRRTDYERLKNSLVHLRIELALSQYVEDQPRELVLSDAPFSDEKLGTCRIDPLSASYLDCLKPFHSPGFIASFDAQQSPCSDDDFVRADIRRSWSYSSERDFLEPGISPITDYSISFRSGVKLVSTYTSERATHLLRLCPGTKVRIADPQLKQHFRLKLETPGVPLRDIAEGAYPTIDFSPPTGQ